MQQEASIFRGRLGWVRSTMDYYRFLGDVSTPISSNYPLTVYTATEYGGIVIQTSTCQPGGYWSSLELYYLLLLHLQHLTHPYTSLHTLWRKPPRRLISISVRSSSPSPAMTMCYSECNVTWSARLSCFSS